MAKIQVCPVFDDIIRADKKSNLLGDNNDAITFNSIQPDNLMCTQQGGGVTADIAPDSSDSQHSLCTQTGLLSENF